MSTDIICLEVGYRRKTTLIRCIHTLVATGIEAVGRQYGLPVLFGLLTSETVAQAEARAGGAVGNKGHECAEAALAMISLLTRLKASSPSAP